MLESVWTASVNLSNFGSAATNIDILVDVYMIDADHPNGVFCKRVNITKTPSNSSTPPPASLVCTPSAVPNNLCGTFDRCEYTGTQSPPAGYTLCADGATVSNKSQGSNGQWVWSCSKNGLTQTGCTTYLPTAGGGVSNDAAAALNDLRNGGGTCLFSKYTQAACTAADDTWLFKYHNLWDPEYCHAHLADGLLPCSTRCSQGSGALSSDYTPLNSPYCAKNGSTIETSLDEMVMRMKLPTTDPYYIPSCSIEPNHDYCKKMQVCSGYPTFPGYTKPTAAIAKSTSAIKAGQSVTFTATGSGGSTPYQYNFDGTWSSSNTFNKTYTWIGGFAGQVIVKDCLGAQSYPAVTDGMIVVSCPDNTSCTPTSTNPGSNPSASDSPRVGKLVYKSDKTVYYVTPTGLLGFSSSATFYSWGYAFDQVVPANSAETLLSQIGIVPTKQSGCGDPSSQLAGSCGSSQSSGARVGQLVYKSDQTVYYVGNNVLYGFTDAAIFNSWGFKFTDVLPANSAESSLSMAGTVPAKQAGCSNVLSQIGGTCGNSTIDTTIRVGVPVFKSDKTVWLVGANGLYGFTDAATFTGWGFTFDSVKSATNAEAALPVLGNVPAKKSGFNDPISQIKANP